MSVLADMAHPRPGRRAKLFALAALDLMVEKLGAEPVVPTLEVRALLAFLCFVGNGERKPFEDFWRNLVDPYESQTEYARGYMRRTYGRTHFYGVVRASMAEGKDYHRAIAKIVDQHRRANDPEYAQRMLASEAVRLAAAVNVLKATKGHPRSAGSARLAAYMRANSGSADGYRLDRDTTDDPAEDKGGCGWL